jgi:molybdopterin converting factor small subunit
MKITLKMYAHLGDLLPPGAYQNKAEIEVADDVSLNEIIDRFKVPREMAHLVLLNGVFICATDRDQRGQIKAGDALAIWPPVAGG